MQRDEMILIHSSNVQSGAIAWWTSRLHIAIPNPREVNANDLETHCPRPCDWPNFVTCSQQIHDILPVMQLKVITGNNLGMESL